MYVQVCTSPLLIEINMKSKNIILQFNTQLIIYKLRSSKKKKSYTIAACRGVYASYHIIKLISCF